MTYTDGFPTKKAAVEHAVRTSESVFTIAGMAELHDCHQSVISTVVNDMLDEGYPFEITKDERNVRHYRLLSQTPDPALVGQRQKRAARGSVKKKASSKKAVTSGQKAPAPKPVYPGLDDNLVVRGLIRDNDGDVTIVLTDGQRSWTATIIGQTA